jgi:lysophospholipase L1-like esterase
VDQTIRVVAIGDSVIHGRQDPGGGWVGYLRRELESRDKLAEVYNLGIGGQTSSAVLIRLIPEVSARMANIVILGFGLNDLMSDRPESPPSVSVDVFRSNIEQAAVALHEQQVERLIVAQIHPVDATASGIEEMCYPLDRWIAYNQVIAQSASRYSFEVIRFSELKDFSLASGSLSDLIHPSPLGHMRMAKFALPLFLA